MGNWQPENPPARNLQWKGRYLYATIQRQNPVRFTRGAAARSYSDREAVHVRALATFSSFVVLFLCKARHSHSTSFHTSVLMGTSEFKS